MEAKKERNIFEGLDTEEFIKTRQEIIDILTRSDYHKVDAAQLCASALNNMYPNEKIIQVFRVLIEKQVQ